jgi:hypothetical protein
VFGGLALATAAIVVSLGNDVIIWRGGIVVGAALIGKGLHDIARRSL